MNGLLAGAVAAHGGLDRWNKFNGRLFNFAVLKDVMFYTILLQAILLSSGVAIPIASAQTWGSRICIE
jgi:hypothetical protein